MFHILPTRPTAAFLWWRSRSVHRNANLHRNVWLCLILASLGVSWFAYQCFLVPQPARFVADWGASRWVQAADSVDENIDGVGQIHHPYLPAAHSPIAQVPAVAYFRHITAMELLPDAAFISIAADQVFSLYVNKTLAGSNSVDFSQGDFPRAYNYDVLSLLQPGANVVAVRVANIDGRLPAVHVNFGIVRGWAIFYEGSGDGQSSWQGTVRSDAVYPRYAAKSNNWTSITFDASSWLPVHVNANPSTSVDGLATTINPALYAHPIADRWVSAGAGYEGYYVRRLSLPSDYHAVWLRLAATGIASVYLNGQLLIMWDGQAPAPRQHLADYLSEDQIIEQYRSGLPLGVYDVTPYLHAGSNIVAVHVQSPGISAALVNPENVRSALALDMLVDGVNNGTAGNAGPEAYPLWLSANVDWHASLQPVSGWSNGSQAALSWPPAAEVGHPGVVSTFYLPENTTSRNVQFLPWLQIIVVVVLSVAGVIALWLMLSLLLQPCFPSLRAALETMSLAYLPTLVCEALLICLAREPQIPRPFPYVPWCAGLLLLLTGTSFLLFSLNALRAQKRQSSNDNLLYPATCPGQSKSLLKVSVCKQQNPGEQALFSSFSSGLALCFRLLERIRCWLYLHHAPLSLCSLLLLAVPLIGYNLAYEPFWQDELSSFYAAQGVLQHGLPFFPSGFLYEKAELYSYLLAGWRLVFGDQGAMLRLVSAIEYLASIPLLYVVGSYFFDRRVALLAAAMLALSPFSLVWGRQVRMYEQAQLLTLLVVFLCYKAVHEYSRPRWIYLAAFCLIIDYLSHEEIFIILPGLLICIGLLWKRYCPNRPFYRRHWLIAALLGGSVIAVQLLLTSITHPPVLGTDSSQRPFVQLTTENIPYYIDLLFFPSALNQGSQTGCLTLNSILALAGCLLARQHGTSRTRYCVLFLLMALLTLILTFTMQADRYLYPLLPLYYLVGASAFCWLMRSIWCFACPSLALSSLANHSLLSRNGTFSVEMRWLARLMVILLCACILIFPILPINGYSLFISRLVGLPYHRHYPDYDAVGYYMQQHWQQGDIVISVSPDISIFYYVGHVDYFLSIDRALYLLEHDGHIIGTTAGARALLNQDDLRTVLASHSRIWIISDNGTYQAQAAKRFAFPSDFHIVFEGYGSAVYFRGG